MVIVELKRQKKGCFDYDLPEIVTQLNGTCDAYNEVSQPSTLTGAVSQPRKPLCQGGDLDTDTDDDELDIF